MATIGELLDQFHNLEKDIVENITPLTDDKELRNGLVAWKSVGVIFKDAGVQCELKSEVDKWNWLWSQVNFDQAQFGIVAGLRTQDIGSVLERLKGLRLIYPDGSINGMARQFLQSQIMAKLQGKRPRGRPATEKSDK
jgi:hypothetical protein